jgi:hypothetical protein
VFFKLFGFECTWWRFFQKRVVRIKFYIYVFYFIGSELEVCVSFLAHLAKGNVSFCITWRPSSVSNCLWQPCLLMDWDEMSIRYRGPSIDASYQVSIHLAEGFQRRRLKCEKLTDDGRRTPSDGKSSHCVDWLIDFFVFNATFSNMSAINHGD